MAQTKEGAMKLSAKASGLSLSEWKKRRESGMKWCGKCKMWERMDNFNADSSRWDGLSSKCRICCKEVYRKNYRPVPAEKRKRMGPMPFPERDNDSRQARAKINLLVRTGRLPKPNNIPCIKCGHKYTKGSRRHEYHHVYGYSAGKHLIATPVCTKCHHAIDGRWAKCKEAK